MADHTEIYLCKAGQSLEQAKIDFVQHVMQRHEAEQDAIERCNANASLVKLVYYMVNDSGKFRSIYSHESAAAIKPAAIKPAATKPRTQATSERQPEVTGAKPARRPRSFFVRGLISLLTEEVR